MTGKRTGDPYRKSQRFLIFDPALCQWSVGTKLRGDLSRAFKREAAGGGKQ
jgi:hypothetical protein